MRHWLFLLLIAVSQLAYGQLNVTATPAIKLDGIEQFKQLGSSLVVPQDSKVVLKSVAIVSVKSDAANVTLRVTDIDRNPVEFEKTDSKNFLLTNPGKYWIEVTAIDFEKNLFEQTTATVVVGDNPDPPTPEPGPTPEPEPGPTPGPAPIDLPGLRVLIVYESAEASTLSAEQRAIFYSNTLRTFLNNNCVREPSGNSAAWRLLDQDTQYTDPENVWAKALKRPRQSLPWIIISNGTTGYEGPLPGTIQETIELVEKYQQMDCSDGTCTIRR